MYLGSPVAGPRIVPKGKERTAADKLPNGRPAFRVTQGFYDASSALGGKRHEALDLGNFNTGDALLASHSGRLVNKRDPNGALIVEITGSDGWVTGYAHLSRYARAPGAVSAGQLIGYVGTSGLSASPHLHYYRRSPAGVLVDPWVRLTQNRPAKLNGAGINIRRSPSLAAGIYGTSTATRYRDAYTSGYDWVRGGYHGVGPYPYDWRKLWIGGAYRYVARPLVTIL